MKRKIGAAASLALVALGALSSGASADCSSMLIKFDADAFAYDTGYNPATYQSAANSHLNVVGIVSLFGGAYADIDATAPGTEYTFLMTNLSNPAATTVTPLPGGHTRYQTTYPTGNFYIYQDSPRDAPTAAGGMPANPPVAGSVPDRFTDGTPFVEGTLTNFITTVTKFANGTFGGSFRADFTFTGPIGGEYYQRVQGTTCIVGGTWCVRGSAGGQCSIPEGYSAHPNGKWDGPAATDISPATWGAIKQLYR